MTWGSWVRHIEGNSEAIKVLESGLNVYILVHRGPYCEYRNSFIVVYEMLNIKRGNGSIPCMLHGNKPCYEKYFCCAASQQSKTTFGKNVATCTLRYPKDTPPKDILVIVGADNTLSCNIRRRSRCSVLTKEKLSCPREISGEMKQIKRNHYKINLSISNASAQDLLL